MIFKSCLVCAQAEGADDRNRNDRAREPQPSAPSPAWPSWLPIVGTVWACKRKIPFPLEMGKMRENVTGSPQCCME